MDIVKIGIFAIGCVVLGIVGGIAARSVLAGIILAVFVFVGWVLWRLFKMQNNETTEQPKDTTSDNDSVKV